jgi:hypothetical protein
MKRLNLELEEAKLEGFDKGVKATQKWFIEKIDNLKNPYPEDVFPKIELSEFQAHTINDFLCSHLRITLDGFSAELMRRARNNLLEELFNLNKSFYRPTSHNFQSKGGAQR